MGSCEGEPKRRDRDLLPLSFGSSVHPTHTPLAVSDIGPASTPGGTAEVAGKHQQNRPIAMGQWARIFDCRSCFGARRGDVLPRTAGGQASPTNRSGCRTIRRFPMLRIRTWRMRRIFVSFEPFCLVPGSASHHFVLTLNSPHFLPAPIASTSQLRLY